MHPVQHGANNPANAPFTDSELAEFHRDDIHSGKAVIILMSAIFSTGLVLYTIVAYFTFPG